MERPLITPMRPFRRGGRTHLARGLALVALALALWPARSTPGFGGAGPYTHIRITLEAMERFSYESGYDVDPICAETLIQASVVSDNAEGMEQRTFHCDSNDLAGCSFRLDQFKQKANGAFVREVGLENMGRALHIVQDFYSHSNWVESYQFLMIPAPIEVFRDVVPPVDVQTGYFPDLFPDFDAQLRCYTTPESEWNRFIYGATHGCLNKDSNVTFRGIAPVPNGFGMTYHELAARYATDHSVTLLHYFAKHSPAFRACFMPRFITGGCGYGFLGEFR